MADRPPISLTGMDDEGLGTALVDLGRSLATPAAGSLAAAVRARLKAEAPPRSWTDLLRAPVGGPGRRANRLALVLALVALAIGATIAAAGLLGLPGLRFFFEPGPAPSPSPAVPSASPGASSAPGSSLGLGDEIPLAGIDERVGFHVLVTGDPAFGPPDGAYYDPDLGAGHVTLVWTADRGLAPVTDGSDIGLVVTQFRGSLDEEYFAKLIHTGTVMNAVGIGEGLGYWIEGGPHFFFYIGPDGRPVDETRRLVGDVLAFEHDDLTIRLETSASLERALEIAASLR
ncbi:MAG TPA: hypothetical protein VJZ72_08365 [Candidatus Limnocylindrales bacterium]|nr:hypothetical protein [Candidatus Limnocylindrales bacterium]